jgi:hypothetical protein
MVDILNNREWAILIWLLIILGFMMTKKDFRNSVSSFFKTASASKLTIIYFSMIVYTCAMAYLIFKIGLWNTAQIKNTVFWFLFTGLPSMVNTKKAHEDKSYFKTYIKNVFKYTAITEFIINLYSFSLLVELFIVPILFLIVMTSAVAKSDKKHAPVAKILDSLISGIGFCLIAYAFIMIVQNFDKFVTIATLSDFLVPSFLTILFLPFIFFLSLYMIYEDVYITLLFKISNPEVRRFAKFQALLHFNFRIKDLERWENLLGRRERNTKAAISESIKEIKELKKLEEKPAQIPESLGWSPYQAKNFLLSEGVETGYYQTSFDNEWSAISPYIKINDEILSSTLAYYIYGDKLKATRLELHLHLNSITQKIDAHKMLLEYAQILFLKSFKKEMPNNIKQAVLLGKNQDFINGNKSISISKQEWLKHKDKGYSLKFTIQMK